MYSNKLSELIKSLPKNKSGLYKLFDSNKNLIYIGKSYDLKTRLKTTCRYRTIVEFISVMFLDSKLELDLLEVKLINQYKPSLNRIESYSNFILNNFNKVNIDENFGDLLFVDIFQIEIFGSVNIYKDINSRELVAEVKTDYLMQDISNFNVSKIIYRNYE